MTGVTSNRILAVSKMLCMAERNSNISQLICLRNHSGRAHHQQYRHHAIKWHLHFSQTIDRSEYLEMAKFPAATELLCQADRIKPIRPIPATAVYTLALFKTHKLHRPFHILAVSLPHLACPSPMGASRLWALGEMDSRP